jgi:hypothetical protein
LRAREVPFAVFDATAVFKSVTSGTRLSIFSLIPGYTSRCRKHTLLVFNCGDGTSSRLDCQKKSVWAFVYELISGGWDRTSDTRLMKPLL